MEKTMKARIQHKHDIEANWLKATNFIPLVSEIIVYDPDENYDYPRIKIGDGKTNINSLPFVTKDYAKISDIPTKPEDIGALPDSTVIPTVPTKISAFENDKGYLTQHQSLDAYAKTADLGALATKDSLTASDVGALPDTTKIPSTLSDLTADSTHRTVTDTEKDTWNAKANASDIPTKVSDLTNDKGYITSYTETDPTVPSWAKAATKPSYTASEVGALPSTTKIPGALSDLNEDTTHRVVTDAEKEAWNAKSNFSGNYADLNGKPTIPTVPTKVSAFENDAKYLTTFTETDPTVPDWAKAKEKPTYTASEVGALPADTVIPTVPTYVSAFANDAGYLTEHQSLEGLATEEWVEEKFEEHSDFVAQPEAPEDINVLWIDTDDDNAGSGGNVGWNSVKSFGAVGDGETDDTDAIQSALDAGGVVYFPSGVYKVTRQLTTNVPCTIRMERIYPGSYNENTTELSGYDHPKTDYPTDDTNMGYGARIETYATDGFGLLVTDGSSVDGLAIRAMEGFTGVVLKYDGSKGCRSYPSTSRFRHIKVDCDVSTIKPESLFDFFPYGNYGTIVEDVIIGSNHTRQFAKYGFRTSLVFWANSIRLRDIVVDVVAEYPFYINANGKQAKNWTISNVAVQAFSCQSNWLVPTHTNIAYINGLSALHISGCKLWDVNADEGADNPTTVSGDVIYNGVISAAAFGNDGWFDSLDTVLKEQLRVANELNLAKLVTTVITDATTGNHTVKLSDGNVEKSFVIPATALSDEQIANGVTQWMVDNADPKPVIGVNKLNPDECFDGALVSGAEQASDYYWTTGYVPCQKGDAIRFYDTQIPPDARTLPRYYLYDSNKNALNGGSSFNPSSDTILIETDDTAYIRMLVSKTGTWAIPFTDRDKCMVTINTTMGAFEPYTVTMEGGIASYIDLDAIVEKIDLTEYAKKTYVQEYAQPKGNYLTEHQDLSSYAKTSQIPTKTSQLTNDSGYLASVPSEYVTESELAAKKYLTSYTETDPTVPAWAKATTKPSYTASEVGADASGTASAAVSAHNTETNAHADIREQIGQLSKNILDLKNYVTPQMFGAVGDGLTDDTVAVQAALDNGGLIYFPAGRYKVTSLLTASKSCRIEMFKQYPNCYQPNDAGNYPLTEEDNWMGSRIETYSPNGGLIAGASTEIDGLYMRAMTGFAGILFKFDESVGLFNYPSTVRLSHIRLDVNTRDTIPEVMFDFVPKGSYRYFLDDINIGRRHVEFCEYGFRADLSQVSDSNWANNVYISGLCIDLFADYPLYVDGAHRAAPWHFEGLAIQTYPYDTIISNGYGNGRTEHQDIVTLKNLQETTFTSCYLWDLFQADYRNVFVTENVTNTSCIGCSSEFNQIESALAKQLAYPKNFNIKNMGVDLVTDENTGDNQLTFSDPQGNIKRVMLPAAVLSDEQVDSGVEKWMDENSTPYEVVGKNKVDVTSEDFRVGYYLVKEVLTTHASMSVTNFIEASYKDVIRMSKQGAAVSGYNMVCYDKDKVFLKEYDIRANNSHGISPSAIEVLTDGTAYIRISATQNSFGSFDTLESNQICITVNNKDISYEPYRVSIEGGLGEFIVLQNLNGSKYKLAVDNDGLLVANPVDGSNPTYYKLTDEDKDTIANEVIAKLPFEEWTFTLEDDSTVTKKVVLK